MADDARRRLELLGIAPQEIDEIARTGQARRRGDRSVRRSNGT